MSLKKIIHTFFNNTGIYIGKRPTYKGKANFSVDGLHYGMSFPSANYAPWQGDEAFMNIYNQVKKIHLLIFTTTTNSGNWCKNTYTRFTCSFSGNGCLAWWYGRYHG